MLYQIQGFIKCELVQTNLLYQIGPFIHIYHVYVVKMKITKIVIMIEQKLQRCRFNIGRFYFPDKLYICITIVNKK
jgi:hypothetical protein